ncbi:hypothetical protein LOD99_6734 [Oopsacas minuta]|uniref:Integrase catalytic domain-containing protein n=1 Tax=Oopsacas minuta TaxID=111878 RepID=A0AAV7JLK0_9METZ|nr:hypothetical protein LOD99_6734 [Oopsacas minuta]
MVHTQLKIDNRSTAAYHPQSNGLVEATILKICLKRVSNDDENCDLIDAEAFSAIPQPPPAPFSFIPCTQVSERLQVARRQESVYSPSQNVPLRHYYLNSNLSGSSEKVDERSVSRAYQVSEALDYTHSLVDKPDDFKATQIGVCDEDESDISEVTSNLSEGDVSPWNKLFCQK